MDVAWIKIIFAIMIATDVSLVGWLFSNYNELTQIKQLVSLLVVALISIGVVVVNRFALNKINNLEKL